MVRGGDSPSCSGHNSDHAFDSVGRLEVTRKGASHFADYLGIVMVGHSCSFCSYSEAVHEKPSFKFSFSFIQIKHKYSYI